MTESVARLRGDQLTLGYGSYTVAKNLNVSIPDGHFTAIIGPNGCGKSTLLRTLSRLMTPIDGHVWLDGEQIQRYASKEVARQLVCWRKTPPHRAISPYKSWSPEGVIRISPYLPAGARKMPTPSPMRCVQQVSLHWRHKASILCPAVNASGRG